MIRRALKTLLLLVPIMAVSCAAAFWHAQRSEIDRLRARLYVGPLLDKAVAIRAVVGHDSSALGQARSAPSGVELRLSVYEPSGGQRVYEGTTNVEGVADFNGELQVSGPDYIKLRLEQRGIDQPLADGVWVRERESRGWTSGGPIGSAEGLQFVPRLAGLTVKVVEGVLAVPFVGTLSLSRDSSGERAGIVNLNLSGATFADTGQPARDVNLTGNAELQLKILPSAHVVELSVRTSREPDGAHAILPVVPGAMTVSRDGERLTVLSPVPRSHAYLAFVSDDSLLGLDTVALSSAASDNATGAPADGFVLQGELQLPARVRQRAQTEPIWVVTSSEPDLQSMAAVGWPLNRQAGGEARKRSLALAVDGFMQGRAFRQLERKSARMSVVKGLFSALALELVLLVLYIRASATRDVHLIRFLGPPVGRALWLGLACVVLGFTVIAYLFWLRL